ncbi:hypothetical protein EBR03_02695 [bacterium]|nr:hypothetical protein [bacterium]
MLVALIQMGLLFLTAGCVLNGYEKPPQKLKTPYVGAVSLVDLSTVSEKGEYQYEAQITASFSKTQQRTAEAIRRANIQIDPAFRGIQCQLTSETQVQKGSETSVPVSVGPLELRTVTASNGLLIPEISPGVYQKMLLPHFAAGLYFLKASGLKDQTPSFAVEFSMPEEVRNVRVNGHGLEEGPAVVQKSADCSIEIDPPTMPSDMNIIEVLVLTEQNQQKRILACGILESQLEQINGKEQLMIPTAQLAGLYASPSAVIEVLRVNALSGTVASGPQLRLDGIRAWLWPALVAE